VSTTSDSNLNLNGESKKQIHSPIVFNKQTTVKTDDGSRWSIQEVPEMPETHDTFDNSEHECIVHESRLGNNISVTFDGMEADFNVNQVNDQEYEAQNLD